MNNFFFKDNKKSIIKSGVENEKFVISGVMSRPIVDFENEVIGSEAYADTINTIKERYAKGQPIPMFIEHRRKELSLPVGKVVDAWSDENGLYFRSEIAGGSIGEPIRELIKGGYLYSVSIGGDALAQKNYFDHTVNKDVKKITKMELRELSLTGLPVNSEAVFSLEKSLNKEQKEVKLLMKSLDKAIDAQKQILSLEKAVNADNLGPEELKRIKDALNNLGTLLGIDLSSEGGMGATNEQGMTGATAPNTNPAQPQPMGGATSEMAPQREETKQKEPTRQVVDQNAKNDQSDEFVEDEMGGEEEEEALVGTGGSKLDEINSKLDQLLGGKSGGKVEKDEYAIVEDGDEEEGEGDEFEEEENESEGEEEEEGEEGERKEEENKFNKFKKKPKMIKRFGKSLQYQGGENMEVLKCRGCGSDFEMTLEKSYDAKFCPQCGDRLEKSEDKDIQCEDCGSVFQKSEEYSIHYCPKCGKSMKDSIAVAPQPQGAKTQVKSESEMPKGSESVESIAVAPEPQGAKTKVEPETKKETGSSVEEFKGGTEIDGVAGKGDAGPGERANKEDEDLNKPRPSGKPMLSSFSAEKVSNYGKDRLGKSLEEKVDSIAKAVETLQIEKSTGKKSVVPEAVEEKRVEKSVASQEDIDRSFAKLILKK